jgi:hypothetical protein
VVLIHGANGTWNDFSPELTPTWPVTTPCWR